MPLSAQLRLEGFQKFQKSMIRHQVIKGLLLLGFVLYTLFSVFVGRVI